MYDPQEYAACQELMVVEIARWAAERMAVTGQIDWTKSAKNERTSNESMHTFRNDQMNGLLDRWSDEFTDKWTYK